jgi:hypothetical protein
MSVTLNGQNQLVLGCPTSADQYVPNFKSDTLLMIQKEVFRGYLI